jgi:acyl-CoA synthetase (AMP-forming)/AMP-acid ligase II
MIIGHSQNQFGSFNISRKDVIVNWTPLYHDMGLMCNFIFAFIHRIRLVMIPPLAFIMHPFIWLKAMHAFKGTITWAPNFAFAVCVDRINLKRYPEIDLSHVRMFINASETISPGTFNKFYAKFSRCGLKREALTTSYGCAENTGTIAVSKLSKPVTIISIKRKSLINGKVELFRQGKVNKFSKGKVDLVSLGCALPGNKITIRRKDNVILSEMEIGEIVCKSNTTIKKYYKQRRLTTQNLKNGWLRTGDLGFLKNDELFFVGRIDEEIKIAGIKYFPSEIEQVINAINGVRKGCMAAFGVFDEALGTNRLVVLAESRLKNQEARERLVCNIKKEIAQRFGLTCYDVIVLPQGMLQKTTSGKKMHQEMKYRYLNGEFSVNKRLP